MKLEQSNYHTQSTNVTHYNKVTARFMSMDNTSNPLDKSLTLTVFDYDYYKDNKEDLLKMLESKLENLYEPQVIEEVE